MFRVTAVAFLVALCLATAASSIGERKRPSMPASHPVDSPHASRLDKEKYNKIFDALINDSLEGKSFDVNGQAGEMKRSLLQNVTESDVVRAVRWDYKIFTFGFVRKDLIYAVDLSFNVLVSHDDLLSFQAVPELSPSDNIVSITSSNTNSKVILFMGLRASYISRDGGVTYTRIASAGYRDILFHPTQPEWLLAQRPLSSTSYGLFVSKNAGADFSLIASNIWQYDWCRAGTGGLADERVCTILGGEVDATFQYTDDLGRSWVKPLAEPSYFFYVHDRFFTLVAHVNSTFDLFISDDDGDTFRRAILPSGVTVGVLERQQFMEDDNGVIWLVVHPEGRADGGKSSSGSLYVSDADGYKFTKALDYVHTIDNYWDVELVRSVEGTLLANQLILASPLLLRTKITFDNGDTWSYLDPPDTDASGKAYKCKTEASPDPCKLNLFGISTWYGVGGAGDYGSFYTQSQAIGMIIGTGNVGTALNNSNTSVNTYFSRDGGLSWDEIMPGSTIYEYADLGGLLILAHNTVPTSEIFYSFNGGETFGRVSLNETIMVSNILAASTVGERVIVLGYDPVATSARRFWALDFSAIHERNCTDSDYEFWEPHEGVSTCVLGHDVLYRRRKRDSECFTDDGLNHIVNVTNCVCSEADYECDYGYERTITTNKCVQEVDAFTLFNQTITESCAKNNSAPVYISSGYRKLPGDTCVNEITAYQPKTYECQKVSIFNTLYQKVTDSLSPTTIGVIVVLVIFVLVLGVFLGAFLALRSEWFRRTFPNAPLPDWVVAGYSNELMEETLSPGDLDVELDDQDDEEENLGL